MHIPIFLRVASLALGQLYDFPNASEVTQKDMSKIDQYQSNTKTQQGTNYSVVPL